MKIIQSLWLFGKYGSLRNKNGWLAAEFHWMSWALSSLQLSKYYKELEIYLNDNAEAVLIDLLELPYTSVNLYPGNIEVNEEAWALAKIYTYSFQKEPFLHVDGDVFIWKPFESKLVDAPLVAQNKELALDFYSQVLKEVNRDFRYIPPLLKSLGQGPFNSCNAGVLGGNDIHLLRKFSHCVIDFVARNEGVFIKSKSTNYCMLFEQLYFYYQAEQSKVPISYVFDIPVDNPLYIGFADFSGVPHSTSFIHTMGKLKQVPAVCNHLSKRLRKDFPETYYKIL
ncbi:hypothetical protein LAG90_17980 [Marinilongibacter aquaticus]|uniref:DUF6734 family protein n=1 Tax=Marinilongibacter aquaticus TaxID=2975157 RepID=UPI0021BDA500|nr:DUF6734 family protein [Marinilongibacter aquaticus]UBM58691.1 hypothetical protein LAG90_17980 [Marinilongibacter aquaticus]